MTLAAAVRGAVPIAIEAGTGPILVAPKTWAVRVTVDLPVRFTYAYLLEGDFGVLVVDPGWDDPATENVLIEAMARAGFALTDLLGIVVTHAHRDHLGSAPDLARRAQCWIGMHASELRDIAGATTVTAWRAREARWLDALGVPPHERAAALIPEAGVDSILRSGYADRVFADGDEIDLGDRVVGVMHTPGHSAGSICLVDETARVIFTGDTLLPRISPNVGWSPDGPSDPLGDYLASLHRLSRYAEWTALPGHEWPFTGVDSRAGYLIDHHAERNREILAHLADSGDVDAWTLATRLTWSRAWSELSGFQRRIAAAETAAHLQHLLRSGEVGAGDPGRYRVASVANS